jgi:hypothetical protein
VGASLRIVYGPAGRRLPEFRLLANFSGRLFHTWQYTTGTTLKEAWHHPSFKQRDNNNDNDRGGKDGRDKEIHPPSLRVASHRGFGL